MPKTIVLLCDGTSNEIARNRTNILRLYGCLDKDDAQLVYYDPGVGTFGAENAFWGFYRKFIEVLGMVTGLGIDTNVKEAYRFLVENYDDGSSNSPDNPIPDRIFIVGFSRGAYTARILAGFIHAFGLIEPRNLNLLNYAYRAYKKIDTRQDKGADEGASNAGARRPDRYAEVKLFERMLQPRRPKIAGLILFDTVASVIEWTSLLPRIRDHAHTSDNPSVQAVRHALALDERRSMYLPTLWPEDGDHRTGSADDSREGTTDVREVWFSGVHGDVGGGYPEESSQLAKFPLTWLIDESAALGLRYSGGVVQKLVMGQGSDKGHVPPDPLAKPNVSMTWAWKVVEFVPRFKSRYALSRRKTVFGFYLPLCERRHVPEGAKIHASVFERRGTSADYPQPNIPQVHEVVGEGDPQKGLR